MHPLKHDYMGSSNSDTLGGKHEPIVPDLTESYTFCTPSISMTDNVQQTSTVAVSTRNYKYK